MQGLASDCYQSNQWSIRLHKCHSGSSRHHESMNQKRSCLKKQNQDSTGRRKMKNHSPKMERKRNRKEKKEMTEQDERIRRKAGKSSIESKLTNSRTIRCTKRHNHQRRNWKKPQHNAGHVRNKEKMPKWWKEEQWERSTQKRGGIRILKTTRRKKLISPWWMFTIKEPPLTVVFAKKVVD